jgi:hypothetical protein
MSSWGGVRFRYREQRYDLERRLLLVMENLETCSNVRIKRVIVESIDEYRSRFIKEEHEVERMIGDDRGSEWGMKWDPGLDTLMDL